MTPDLSQEKSERQRKTPGRGRGQAGDVDRGRVLGRLRPSPGSAGGRRGILSQGASLNLRLKKPGSGSPWRTLHEHEDAPETTKELRARKVGNDRASPGSERREIGHEIQQDRMARGVKV